MTEIPEHLLKRSRERRQALGLSTGEEASAPAAATPAPSGEAPATQAAAPPAPPRRAEPPAPAAPPPPKPLPPYIQAAQRRKRIPFWAMPVLAGLPLLAWLYAEAMQPPSVEVAGPLAIGAEAYGSCASCHGSAGEGGVGYPLANGEVLQSFDTLEDQVQFVYVGNRPYIGKPYGNGRHVGGALGGAGQMPAWGADAGGEFTDAQIVAVVCHERYTLSGGDQTSEEFLNWCAPDAERFTLVEEGGLAAAGIEINLTP